MALPRVPKVSRLMRTNNTKDQWTKVSLILTCRQIMIVPSKLFLCFMLCWKYFVILFLQCNRYMLLKGFISGIYCFMYCFWI
jgi:prolipoprotein diacylglyceryltransferase